MKINPQIFRAYDIRGIYPKELDERAAYLIGRAFVKFFKKPRLKIVVGRDNRLSSPSLFKALTKGIIDQGADVIDIGLSTTPMHYFTVAHFKFDGGVMITASHNPPQYNGFKFVREKAIPISEKTGLKEIKKLTTRPGNVITRPGRVVKKEVLKDYIEFNLKDFHLKKIKPLKIVIDTANAVPGILVPKIFKKINCKIYYLFAKLDGSFPNHLPSPHEEKNLKSLKKEVLRKKADLGIAFDGDGDRVIFVDEKGKMIPGDLITALLASLILKENPGEKVLCDVRSSNIVRDVVKEMGGIPVIGRIGHSFIKERMRRENIIFQGELNGHYYLRTHYFCEAPFFVIFKILEEISRNRKSISELVKPFQKYSHSGEINFKVKNKKKVFKTLEDKFRGGEILKIDGLRIDFPNWWFNVRPSHTEPLLRLVVEARTKKLMEQKIKEIKSIIEN
ncbi:MAG: phosphomannomutase/phosphoglucomutase [Candidatus Nealsonbacteria bacterium CG_4_10_14_3_um_filter_36_16]|uniref:Phosphomannomutase/phosphoglucomutase n=2 Tax=Candidatus Nealsoniibacteriota TaxID=1817911 RepID=A0A2M8DLP6_9BACT|nr:MAG: phosphomannomutase/phosphoglucomutase [Candidatus Nealsonbacteria bacterium CG_4_10_14_3_um_filter_36_16]PJB98763.1 MAG: phosphomannomutase/phosphoglucomutase [Candidatus Nealsonbacteria bacterium CG_4_9_14_0_8_um_filter_36_17]